MSKPAKNTLALVSCSNFRVAITASKKLKARTIKEVLATVKYEKQGAASAILAGLFLHRTKASLKHGEWGGFIENELAKAMKWTAATAGKNTSYYQRLSTEFYEQAGLKQAEIIAALDGQKAASKTVAAALHAFIGDLSLNELLIKFDIKSVGLSSSLKNGGGGGGKLTDAEKFDQAREQAWEETWTSVQRIRASLTEPEKLQLLTDPKQIEKLQAELIEANQLAAQRLADLRKTKAA
jgi:hypothetical protein